MLSWRGSSIRMDGNIDGAFIFLVAIDQPMHVVWR